MSKLLSPHDSGSSNPCPISGPVRCLAALCLALTMHHSATVQAQSPSPLDTRLLAEKPAVLVGEARIDGDARRGSLLFHGPALACAKCHRFGVETPGVGPDLTVLKTNTTPEQLVSEVLDPSRKISEGFETVTIATRDGRVLTGVRAREHEGTLEMFDASRPGELLKINLNEIDDKRIGGASSMPAGLVNTLASRQEFLDLLRYLIEIREGGRERARALKPSALELSPPPVPPYELNLDHARLLSAFDPSALQRGREVYERVCASCHGTPQRPGSLPSSPKFWSDQLNSLGDPLKMYETITHGRGLMPPQGWLVPKQKYEVIHFIREQYFKQREPAYYPTIDAAYLAGLPAGTEVGPEPSGIEPWVAMNYGPSLTATIEVGRSSHCFAYKGISVRLDPGPGGVSQGRHWVVFDEDTMRMAGAWSDQDFIDWNGILFNGRHEIHPAANGKVLLATPNGPGWANPRTGVFDDPRALGRDGVRYGPLPRNWLHFLGRYEFGNRVVLSYTVGDAKILESPTVEFAPDDNTKPIFVRNLQIGKSPHDLTMLIGFEDVVPVVVGDARPRVINKARRQYLQIPAGATPLAFKLMLVANDREGVGATFLRAHQQASAQPEVLESMVQGGPKRWGQSLVTQVEKFDDDGPFAIDVFTLPESNPWQARMRPTGFDFLDGGQAAAVCTWDGDVWRVDGLDRSDGSLTWRRIATGLFQPLGLKVIDGAIYVGCRDQIAILRDLNADGETDFYENFNNDHQVTEHFHEFAMGLQTDTAGSLYYAKAARHGQTALVPQHGTLLRVSRDGLRTDIIASGFRAPNGVCVNEDGTFFVTDQEGHWIPKNRLNWIDKPGKFYGNMWGYTDVIDTSDAAMERPVCWLTNNFDRSPAEPLWVTSPKWGRLQGSLLSLSYGYGQVYVAPHERVGGTMQGAMAALPLPRFPTGLIRGRFHPSDGQLYVCGMYSWAGSQTRPGGFFRIRATGKPMNLPIAVHARKHGLQLRFSDPLDPQTAKRIQGISFRSWALNRTENYGSAHINEREHSITQAELSDDGCVLTLSIKDFGVTPCYELGYNLIAADGEPVSGALNGSIHVLGDE